MAKVIVNGTFDVIHVGHIKLLNFAKTFGDLTVAIDSDQRVKKLKGSTRPINNQEERIFLLQNLKAVDCVKIFDTDQELIDIISIHDIMVKGSDYINKPIIGREVCPKIIFFDRIDEYSSTKKIQSIIDRG